MVKVYSKRILRKQLSTALAEAELGAAIVVTDYNTPAYVIVGLAEYERLLSAKLVFPVDGSEPRFAEV